MIENSTDVVSRIVFQIEITLAESDDTIAVIIKKPGSGPMRRLSQGKKISFQGVIVVQATV